MKFGVLVCLLFKFKSWLTFTAIIVLLLECKLPRVFEVGGIQMYVNKTWLIMDVTLYLYVIGLQT